MSEMADNLARIRERMERAAGRAGRNPKEIRLVGVSKTVEAGRAAEAVAAGVEILGENYIQEAQRKIEILGHPPVWHFIGHLQSNKAKTAVRLFDLIHSVDSLNLAREISRQAEQQGKIQPVLLQVDFGSEASKFGVDPDEVGQLVNRVSSLSGIRIEGLMTLPPLLEAPEATRPYFAGLRRLRDTLLARGISGIALKELSMGMSHDFEAAIEEGATLIRVGTALFGSRPLKPPRL